MRQWYARFTPQELREKRKGRDVERVRAADRKRGGARGKPVPEHHRRAVRAVYLAKKAGDLVPEPCLFCDAENVVAHHHNYDRQLDVTWLCRVHHGIVHRGF
jgi:hypothetical protein